MVVIDDRSGDYLIARDAVRPGQRVIFDSAGTRSFRLIDIDTRTQLAAPRGLPLQLTFVRDGSFTGTVTALVRQREPISSAVPVIINNILLDD